ncbi:MAG TPA: hypothetical protein VGP62_29680 [Bryobacteraceae bacterium]|nr:hypothetical protein [Bryobacteraceae bacterium]
MQKCFTLLVGLLMIAVGTAQASVTLLLEEPFGNFGGLTPTGHASIYLSRVCAASPVSLRRCHAGEQGVVISRYHRVSGYDWIAIPMLPYLYAVDRPNEVPASVSPAQVAALRDNYRRMNLEELAPDAEDGRAPSGDWIQLVGAAYDRTIYAFGIETTSQQDDEFIQNFNSGPNQRRFNILFHNCADFVRQAVDFYYPHSIHRSFIGDAGIMSPKQAAKCLVSYSKHHRDLQFSSFVIPQVSGSVPRSTAVRGVLESFVKSKKYAVPLVSVAVLHPYVGGSLAFAWLDGSHFDPRKVAESRGARSQPAAIAEELESNGVAAGAGQ